jgi:hypothetical protein
MSHVKGLGALLLAVAILVGCGTKDRADDVAAPPMPSAATAPDQPIPEPGFNPDDPALDTLPESDAARRKLVARVGRRPDFRVPRRVVGGLDPGPLVVAVVSRPFVELSADDPRVRQLNSGQRAVYAMYLADFEVLNGGFWQLWENPSGAIAQDLVGAAKLLGSAEFADIFRDAQALWPDGRIPRDRAERERLLQQLPEEPLAALDARYAETQYHRRTALALVLGGYIRRHAQQFTVG